MGYKMKTLILIITLFSMTSVFAFEDMADCEAGSGEIQKQASVPGSSVSGSSGSDI